MNKVDYTPRSRGGYWAFTPVNGHVVLFSVERRDGSSKSTSYWTARNLAGERTAASTRKEAVQSLVEKLEG